MRKPDLERGAMIWSNTQTKAVARKTSLWATSLSSRWNQLVHSPTQTKAQHRLEPFMVVCECAAWIQTAEDTKLHTWDSWEMEECTWVSIHHCRALSEILKKQSRQLQCNKYTFSIHFLCMDWCFTALRCVTANAVSSSVKSSSSQCSLVISISLFTSVWSAADLSMWINIWEADPLEPTVNSTLAVAVAKETWCSQNKVWPTHFKHASRGSLEGLTEEMYTHKHA